MKSRKKLRPSKKVKTLSTKSLSARQAKAVKGGKRFGIGPLPIGPGPGG